MHPARRVGRNEPCPCGSGKKYKKCHGAPETLDRVARAAGAAPLLLAKAQAEQAQRQRQQGVGKPIISTEFQGYRFVAVRNRLHYSRNWKTFHDFLFDYIKIVMGKEWWMGEVAKAPDERHQILQWAALNWEYQKKFVSEPGKVNTAPMQGATAAHLHLAYDLYALDHAVELQDRLVARLKNRDNFAGARYEVSVAAKLLRAGFDIALEDESDKTRTHVEFTATYKKTGKRFSVEAKQRDASKIRINRLLHRALAKQAEHARMVFLDINEPDVVSDAFPPKFFLHAEDRLKAYERDPTAATLPPAYVIVTNTPWHFSLEGQGFRCATLIRGFRIPELQNGHQFRSLVAAVDARDAHVELHDLMRSMHQHADVPSTFDGSIPEFAFDENARRLVVGNTYSMPDATGTMREGVLESGTVIEQKREAWCVLRLPDGQRIICKISMTDPELQAWRAHPDTFFGVIDRNAGRGPMRSPLDWYDFFFESYSKTPKKRLLEFLRDAGDYSQLEPLTQKELARVYCERLAARVWHEEGTRSTPEPDGSGLAIGAGRQA